MNSIEKAIARHKTLKQLISDHTKKIEVLTLESDKLKRDKIEANNRVIGYSRDDKDQRFIIQAKEAQHQFDQLDKSHADVERQISKLRLELESALAELKDFSVLATAEAMTVLQDDINANRQKAEQLKGMIAENEAIYSKEVEIDSTKPLIDRKIKLLAQVAFGADHSQELAEIDQQIKAAQEADTAKFQHDLNIGDAAYHTVKGLQDMLDKFNQAIDSQIETHRYLMDGVLMSMAETHAKQYQKSADQLLSSIRCLAAVEQMITKIGIRSESGYLQGENKSLVVPCLGSMMPVDHQGLYGHWVTSWSALSEDVDSLNGLLNKQGIEYVEIDSASAMATGN